MMLYLRFNIVRHSGPFLLNLTCSPAVLQGKNFSRFSCFNVEVFINLFVAYHVHHLGCSHPQHGRGR